MGTLIYFIFSIFAKDYHFGGATTKTVICGSLLPKANGGGDRGICVWSQRAIPNIFCSVHGDTMTLVFQLFASHAGRQELSAWFFLPARARVNLQKSLSYVSPCHPEAGYFRVKSQRLTVQKSVTYDAKVRDLRPVIPWLTNRNPIIKPLKIKQARHVEVIPSKACKRAYKHQSKENLWKSMSNCEQVWATVSCLLTDFVSLHCDSEIPSGSNQQAIVRRPHSKLSPGGPIPHSHGKDRFDMIW